LRSTAARPGGMSETIDLTVKDAQIGDGAQGTVPSIRHQALAKQTTARPAGPADAPGSGVVHGLDADQRDPALVRDQRTPVAVGRVGRSTWSHGGSCSVRVRASAADGRAGAVCPKGHSLPQLASLVPQRRPGVRLTPRPSRSTSFVNHNGARPKRAPRITGRQLPRSEHRQGGRKGWLARRRSVSAG
jgi:hypothetical protein